jgi:hypothetical protein
MTVVAEVDRATDPAIREVATATTHFMSAAPHMEDYSGAVLTYASLCPRRPLKSRSHATSHQIDSLPLLVKMTRKTDTCQNNTLQNKIK